MNPKASVATIVKKAKAQRAREKRANKQAKEVAQAVPPSTIETNREDESFTGVAVMTMTGTTVEAVPPVVRGTGTTGRKNKPRTSVSMISKPDAGQSDSWEFDVEQEELRTKSGKLTGLWAVVHADTGAYIGKYSGVKALGYPSLVKTFEPALIEAGYNFTRSLFTTKGGARFFGRYDLSTVKIRGEEFKSIIRLQSSHDGSLSPGFAFEAERLACFNGMMIMSTVFAMSRKHSERLDLGFIAANIQRAIEAGQGHLSQSIDRMSAIAIDDGQARNVVSNLVTLGATRGVSAKAGLFIFGNWRKPTTDEQGLGNNLYRLFNAATRYTRDVNNVGRFESSRKSNLFLTGSFDLAARGENHLARLLAAPSSPLDFDGVTIEV